MNYLAFIPSPSSNGLHIGPLFVHAYGLAYVFAVAGAILVTRRRWEKPDDSGAARLGEAGRREPDDLRAAHSSEAGGRAGGRRKGKPEGGSRELVYECALWGFPAGLIGGRIYFLITSWNEVPKHWWGPFAIWQGGLGIWGGIAGGTLAGLWVLRRRRADIPAFMDAAAPGLLVAQAIGRIGNYFNQELFGGPTRLPWGLQIDPAHRPRGYEHYATFQPTFLYEMIWNLGLAGFLVWLGHHRRVRAPGLFALYVAGYSGFRVFEELLRVDPSHHVLGLRLNFFVASALCVAGLTWFAAIQRGGGWPRRARQGAALLGVAWLVGVAAGCGSHHVAARDRFRSAASSDHGRVLATSAAVSQARRAVATP